MIKVINVRGTTRNIEDTQLAEYERKGYKKVTEKTEKIIDKPKNNNVEINSK